MSCRTCGGTAKTETENQEPPCVITEIKSNTLAVSGGCPDSGTITIELKESEPEAKEECDEISSLFPTDTIQVMRNGQCYTITIDNLLKALDCKRECL
jgi:hypothetical protein